MFEFEGATPKQANNCQKTRINKTKSDTFISDFTHMYVRRAKKYEHMPRKLLYKWDNLPATLVCPCATRTLFLPRAGLEGAGRWDPFVKQTVE